MKYLHRLFFILTSATFWVWIVGTYFFATGSVNVTQWLILCGLFTGKKLGQNIVRSLVNGKDK